MIDWRDPDARPDRRITAISTLRWILAVSLVVAVHGAAAWLALHWQSAQAVPGGPPEAVMIELAPLAVAPEPTMADVAPGPQVTETPLDPMPDPPEETRETPERIVEEPKPVEQTPAPTTEPKVEVPKLPEREHADAVLPPPPAAQKQGRKEPAPKRTASPPTSAPTVRAQQRADRIAAPASSAAQVPAAAAATWQSALMAHLNRHKRYPSGGVSSGVATVAFSIDRSGRVLSSRLVRSSGDPALDSEAVSLARRASPVPAPPAGLADGTFSLSVPIRFNR